jgi:hypothetical protein
MNLAWNPKRWTNTHLDDYTQDWAAGEFGPQFAAEIADIITRYTRYNGRRKPELLTPQTYSLINYQEAETVVSDYDAIAVKAAAIYSQLPVDRRGAFYELVLFPVRAGALLNELYLAAGKNSLYAFQGRASANDYAAETRRLFSTDTNLMADFNLSFDGGKWNHFMDQTHLGYTSWNDPPQNSLRAVPLTQVVVPSAASMGVAVQGSVNSWPGSTNEPVLPPFDSFNRQRHFLEVFDRGRAKFDFTAIPEESWIRLSESKGTVETDQRLWVSVDWERVPKGAAYGTIQINGANQRVVVKLNTLNPMEPSRDTLNGFVEGEGYVSIEPEHFTRKLDAGLNRWIRIPDYGRTLSGMRATQPVASPSATPGMNSPRLEYQMYLFSTGTVRVATVTSPTLNFLPGRGLRLGISFDDATAQILTLVPADYKAQNGNLDWERVVADNARTVYFTQTLTRPGYHTLKYWMVDPGVVLQKIVVDLGGLKPSYLGPPESFHQQRDLR